MKIKIDNIVPIELKEYLLNQLGILDVDINYDNYYIEISVKHNEKTNPNIIMKHIELYKNSYIEIVEFDKEYEGNFKKIKHSIDDLCCEYCYKGMITDLFENEKVKSVKSNLDINKPSLCAEF